MAGKRKNELDPPPISDLPYAAEVLRFWTQRDGPQQVSLLTYWDDPFYWGLLLADVARHASIAYSQATGELPEKILETILSGMQAELESPTDEPIQIS